MEGRKTRASVRPTSFGRDRVQPPTLRYFSTGPKDAHNHLRPFIPTNVQLCRHSAFAIGQNVVSSDETVTYLSSASQNDVLY